jgi:ABC-type glycerol-3-phosphate transport system permease component
MAEEAPQTLRVQVLDKVVALVTAGFALVAALAWNEAIKGLIARYLGPGDGLVGQLVYAVLVTILAVVMSIWAARALARAKRKAAEHQQ